MLRDPQKRAAYDRYGEAGLRGGGGGFHHVDLSEALGIFMRDFGGFGGFDELFGGGAAERRTARRRRGQDQRAADARRGCDGRRAEDRGEAARAVRSLRGNGRRSRVRGRTLHDVRRSGRGAARAALVLRPVRHRRRRAPPVTAKDASFRRRARNVVAKDDCAASARSRSRFRRA